MNSRLARRNQRPFLAVWAVLAVGGVATVLMALWFHQEAQRADQQRFEGITDTVRQMADLVVGNYQRALQQAADSLAVKTEISESEWSFALNRLRAEVDYPGLIEIGLIHVRLAKALPPALEAATADDYSSAEAWRRERFERAATAVRLSPLVFEQVWFEDRRQREVAENSLLREKSVLTRAVETQASRMTGRRALVKGEAAGDVFGTTLVLPVPNPQLTTHWSTNILENKKTGNEDAFYMLRNFVGKRYTSHLLYASFDWQPFIAASLGRQWPELNVDLYAATNADQGYWLGGRKASVAGVPPGMFSTNYVFPMYSSKWTLAMSATPLFAAQSTRYRARLALVGGGAITALMALALGVQIRARLREERASRELRVALSEVERARKDREGLNRDLHDGAIQSLYALHLTLGRSIAQIKSHAPDGARQLADCQNILKGIMGELRQFILTNEAEPSTPGNLGRVLTAMVERMQKASAVEFHLDLDQTAIAGLSDEQSVQLANIAREALSNSLRHGNPQRIEVRLIAESEFVIMKIIDDGLGFAADHPRRGGMGLKNMAARARAAGGEITVHSAANEGTQISVKVPRGASEIQSIDHEGDPKNSRFTR